MSTKSRQKLKLQTFIKLNNLLPTRSLKEYTDHMYKLNVRTKLKFFIAEKFQLYSNHSPTIFQPYSNHIPTIIQLLSTILQPFSNHFQQYSQYIPTTFKHITETYIL